MCVDVKPAGLDGDAEAASPAHLPTSVDNEEPHLLLHCSTHAFLDAFLDLQSYYCPLAVVVAMGVAAERQHQSRRGQRLAAFLLPLLLGSNVAMAQTSISHGDLDPAVPCTHTHTRARTHTCAHTHTDRQT